MLQISSSEISLKQKLTFKKKTQIYSFKGNLMNRGVQRAIVHGGTKSRTQLSD